MRIFSVALALHAAVEIMPVLGASPNLPRSLLEAARIGDVDMVELHPLLWNTGPNALFLGWTPLHEAAREGHSDVVKVLLSYGADPMTRSMSRATPIMIAAQHGHADVVRLLVENVACSSEDLSDAMLAAVYNGRSEVVDYLLALDAKLAKAKNDRYYTQSELAADQKGPMYFEPEDALGMAIRKGHWDVASKLIKHGAPVNDGVFQDACADGATALVNFLIDNGAVIEDPELDEDNLPIREAIDFGHLEVAELLIQRGATRGLNYVLTGDDPEGNMLFINLFVEAGLVEDYEIPAGLHDRNVLRRLLLGGARNTVDSEPVLQELMLPIKMIEYAMVLESKQPYLHVPEALQNRADLDRRKEVGFSFFAFKARKGGVDVLNDPQVLEDMPKKWSQDKITLISSIIGDLVYLECDDLNFYYTVAPFLVAEDYDMLRHAETAFKFLARSLGSAAEKERNRIANRAILNEMIRRSHHIGLRPVVKALFALYSEEWPIRRCLQPRESPQRSRIPGTALRSSLTILGLPDCLKDLIVSHDYGPFNPGFKAKAMQKLSEAIKRLKAKLIF